VSGGDSELVLDNREISYGTSAMVILGDRGRLIRVEARSQVRISLCAGHYQIYFIYDCRPESLYQCNSFSLEDNQQITFFLQNSVGGNDNVPKVNYEVAL
jgi:hypothetical protein